MSADRICCKAILIEYGLLKKICSDAGTTFPQRIMQEADIEEQYHYHIITKIRDKWKNA